MRLPRAPRPTRPAVQDGGVHLVNRSDRDALVLEVGNSDREHDRCVYSDIDMEVGPGDQPYRHLGGAPYPPNNA